MTEYITLALAGIAAVLSLVCVLIRPKQGATLRDLQNLSQELQEEMRALRTEVGGTIHGTLQSTAELQANAQRQVAEAQNTRLRELSEQLRRLKDPRVSQTGMVSGIFGGGAENYYASFRDLLDVSQLDSVRVGDVTVPLE